MRKLFSVLLFVVFYTAPAQQPQKLGASEIYKKIEQLNFLGSVLYVAAHPDDENTRLLSYLSNDLNARTGYLSLTRGDGGQNLIGPELGELLGIIRTQELLAARRIDGGEQFFTRSKDFGYSKHPEETLAIWNKEEVLKDIVSIFRKFRPDIIINRFDHRTPGSTHGHHTSSAILSVEAFELAGDPSAFPEQFNGSEAKQPAKLFFNTSPWFYGDEQAFEKESSEFTKLNTGSYFPLIGLSNEEIAALSRSQHQSQGFGSSGSRGSQVDYLELLQGEKSQDLGNLFAGIDTSWSRIKGGKAIGEILYQVQEDFNFKNPSASIPGLLKAHSLVQELEDEHWKQIKSEELKEIISGSAGLFLEAVAEKARAVPEEDLKLRLEAINRSEIEMDLVSVEILPLQQDHQVDIALQNNDNWQQGIIIRIPEKTNYSSPYWIEEKGSLGMYKVEEPELIGLPESPRVFKTVFNIEISGTLIPFERNIVYKKTDPVKGEVYEAFEIIPEVSVTLADKVLIFAEEAAKRIPVIVKAQQDSITGTVSLKAGSSWKVSPKSFPLSITKGEEQIFWFTVTPPPGQAVSSLVPEVNIGDEVFSREIKLLAYDHIPIQTLLLPAEAKLVKLELERTGQRIAYIEGAGDLVPESLEQLGYTIIRVTPESITAENLEQYQAVVLGIRAYNTLGSQLRAKNKELLAYVENGGNLIVQYNTLLSDFASLSPYPLQLSRDRVTVEHAPVRLLARNHPVLNFPNKITRQDFEGWVQERGLYFPNKWASEFVPILSMNDPGEPPRNGSLLVASYGKGHYIYTGLSFFRELPAGVPGAYRLFTNLISLGSEENMEEQKNISN